MDAHLASAVAAAMAAAIGAYGREVLQESDEATSDAPTALGRAALIRLADSPGLDKLVRESVEDLTENPEEAGAVMRALLRRAARHDPGLEPDLAILVAAHQGADDEAAHGSLAVGGDIQGIISTGDRAVNWIGRDPRP